MIVPWDQWMKLAFGVMGFSRSDFYSFGFREWILCIEGRGESQGNVSDPCDSDRLAALIERYPDGPGHAA